MKREEEGEVVVPSFYSPASNTWLYISPCFDQLSQQQEKKQKPFKFSNTVVHDDGLVLLTPRGGMWKKGILFIDCGLNLWGDLFPR